MAKILIFNNDTDRMETYYRGEGEAMPYNTNSTLNIKNTYYKEVSGIQESNKGDIEEAYPMSDANMKNPDGSDQNSLLCKLNQNVSSLNNAGLSSIDESIGSDLDGYTLVNWKIDTTTGYPTLDYNLEE